MSLIGNPLGELLGPVNRLESAVAELGEAIGAVETLPQIQAELAETREATLQMLEELRGVREDIGGLLAVLSRVIETDGTRDRG